MCNVEIPTTGIFIRELKNRFLCEVFIDGETVECYVPSSCRLGNFLTLSGKQVLLLPTQDPNARTPYSLLAVPYKRNYILLNTSKANKIIADNLHRRYFSMLGNRSAINREQTFGDYKSDLYLPNSKTLIEIKSVICLDKIAVFPTVYSQRTIDQLIAIAHLIDNGYNAALVITSLSPYVQQIYIDKDSVFFQALKPCIERGLQLLAVSFCFANDEIRIKKKTPIKYWQP